MAVRHIGPDKHEVHKGSKGGKTGCGIDTNTQAIGLNLLIQ